jgi:hypothetical protein
MERSAVWHVFPGPAVLQWALKVFTKSILHNYNTFIKLQFIYKWVLKPDDKMSAY